MSIALPIALALAGCATVDPRQDYQTTIERITEATGYETVYRPDEDELVQEQVDSLLSGGLTADEAAQVCLLNNPDLQAMFYEIGMARADVVQAGLQSNPTLALLLAVEGAEPVELPSIRIMPVEDDGPLRQAARSLDAYQWIVFSSVNGVEAFWQALDAEGLDARALAGVRVSAIGPATAELLLQRGVRADSVPTEYVSESVVESLRGHVQPGDRVLLPRAQEGRQAMVDGLRALGATVDHVVAYRTVASEESRDRAVALLKESKIDAVTFTSSSTVRNLVTLLDGDTSLLEGPAIACIGPVTAATARELGLTVDIQPNESTIPNLVAAIKTYFCAA